MRLEIRDIFCMHRAPIKYAMSAIAGAAIASGVFYVVARHHQAGISRMISEARANAAVQARADALVEARVNALLPYCVASSEADPWRYQVLERIRTQPNVDPVQEVMIAGWATSLGQNEPDRKLAEACLRKLNIK